MLNEAAGRAAQAAMEFQWLGGHAIGVDPRPGRASETGERFPCAHGDGLIRSIDGLFMPHGLLSIPQTARSG